jgi:anti-sigma factor RsiW
MSLSNDDRKLQRYLDGELSPSDSAAFAAQLLTDSSLRRRAEAMKQAQVGFENLRENGDFARAPAGFTARVMSEVRRLPSREQMQQQDMAEGAVRLCRRLLLAAAILFGVGLIWQTGLMSPNGATTVEAAPEDIQREMQRLDALIVESLEGSRSGK